MRPFAAPSTYNTLVSRPAVMRLVCRYDARICRRCRGCSTVVNRNVHQGLHGEGFIYALASAGGFVTSRSNLDVDGVDWQIARPGPQGTSRSPKIEIQVKSSSSPDIP